ncbi:MAG: hypothetical protein JNN08_20565 [Bryobacterales bacterium]|nr:hypothetical protein [Bryobacterales bacterium]
MQRRNQAAYIVASAATVVAATMAAIAFGLGAVSAETLPTRWKRVRGHLPRSNQQAIRFRAERIQRVRHLGLDAQSLHEIIQRYRSYGRDSLISSGFLLETTPAKGTARIAAQHRTPAGNALLQEAKDVLFALLFGDESTNTRFNRTQRELLTLTVPASKAAALEFMKASTELHAAGTWQDPDSVSNDERADNLVIEVEYGEAHDESIGDAIIATLRLINNLEVNEQVLYARMIDIEQTTLID